MMEKIWVTEFLLYARHLKSRWAKAGQKRLGWTTVVDDPLAK
jgi:hypothetical protein